jgi:hypothetical protein
MVKKGFTGNLMTSRWVHRFKMLLTENGDKVRGVKSRLTVHGFKDVDANKLLTYSSTATRWSQRLVTAQAAQRLWNLLSADVGNAFLRGLTFAELARITGTAQRRASFIPPKGHDIYIRELVGFENFNSEEWELEMVRAIYGLKDAPRAWRITLHRVMLELGAKARVHMEIALANQHRSQAPDSNVGELEAYVAKRMTRSPRGVRPCGWSSRFSSPPRSSRPDRPWPTFTCLG